LRARATDCRDRFHGVSQGARKKPRVVRGSERLAARLSELKGLVLAEQNMLHHKPPKFPKDKPIKHLGFKSAF